MELYGELGQYLAAHQRAQAANPENWGYVGDLELVTGKLTLLVRHLR